MPTTSTYLYNFLPAFGTPSIAQTMLWEREVAKLLAQRDEQRTIQRVHRFKAHGDMAAIEHIKKFLEKNWNEQ